MRLFDLSLFLNLIARKIRITSIWFFQNSIDIFAVIIYITWIYKTVASYYNILIFLFNNIKDFNICAV
jgi:hypothetical protein